MMGYSVTEAASVLGVPAERVWELLARGVLVGEPEGETGMRVFLQPRPAPAPVAPAEDTITARSNGPERELSPFRELLTEFRSLTERYGQALLALGESRGEVASLRSRVDLLEARIDLRLPMGQPAAAPWPTQSLPAGEAVPAPRAEAAGEPEADHEEDAHRPRRRGARRATESFAQALARAEDPSLSDLARAADADALAAFRSEANVTDEAADADRTLPREVLPAEPVLVADEGVDVGEPVAEETTAAEAAAEEPVTEDTEVREPELVEPEPEPVTVEPEPVTVEPEPVTVEPEPALEASEAVDAWAEPLDALATPVDVGPEPVDVEPELEPAAPVEPVAAPEAIEDAWMASLRATEPEPWPELEVATAAADGGDEVLEQVALEPEPIESAEDVEPADFDAQRYTSAIEQPDWFEAEAEAETDDPWPTEARGDEPTADVTESTATTDVVPPVEPEAPEEIGADSALAEREAEDLDWREPGGEVGADEMEMAGGHGGASVLQEPDSEPAPDSEPEPEPESEQEPQSDPDPALPGSRELDEAMEAFGDLGRSAPATSREDEWPPATGGADRITPSAERAGGFVSRPPRPPLGVPMPRGPATRAYRRLRRIFPT